MERIWRQTDVAIKYSLQNADCDARNSFLEQTIPLLLGPELEFCIQLYDGKEDSLLSLMLTILHKLLPPPIIFVEEEEDEFFDPLLATFFASGGEGNTASVWNHHEAFTMQAERCNLRVLLLKLLVGFHDKRAELIDSVITLLGVLYASMKSVKWNFQALHAHGPRRTLFTARIISSMINCNAHDVIPKLLLPPWGTFWIRKIWLEYSVHPNIVQYGIWHSNWTVFTNQLGPCLWDRDEKEKDETFISIETNTLRDRKESGRYYTHRRSIQLFCLHLSRPTRRKGTGSILATFRSQLVGPARGIFQNMLACLLRNISTISDDIERVPRNWIEVTKVLSSMLYDLQDTSKSYHTMDNNNILDTLRTKLHADVVSATLYIKFAYDCIGYVLSYCGSLSTKATIFSDILVNFFPSASALNPTAAAELSNDSTSAFGNASFTGRGSRKVQDRKCNQLVNGLKGYWEKESYPALVRYFSETAKTYQVYLESGWKLSSLRIWLLNILDPYGVLGVDSYFPEDTVSSISNGHPRRLHLVHSIVCGFCCVRECCCMEASPVNVNHELWNWSRRNRMTRLRRYVISQVLPDRLEQCPIYAASMVPILQFAAELVNHFGDRSSTAVDLIVAGEDGGDVDTTEMKRFFEALVRTILYDIHCSDVFQSVTRYVYCSPSLFSISKTYV